MQKNGYELLAIPLQRVLKVARDFAENGNTSKAIMLERVISIQSSRIPGVNNGNLVLIKVPQEFFKI